MKRLMGENTMNSDNFVNNYVTVTCPRSPIDENKDSSLSLSTQDDDGDAPDDFSTVRDYLTEVFVEDRLISPECQIAWPPRCRDLNPLDYWILGTLKAEDDFISIAQHFNSQELTSRFTEEGNNFRVIKDQ